MLNLHFLKLPQKVFRFGGIVAVPLEFIDYLALSSDMLLAQSNVITSLRQVVQDHLPVHAGR